MSITELRSTVHDVATTIDNLEHLQFEMGTTDSGNPFVVEKFDNIFSVGIHTGEFIQTEDMEDAIALAVDAFLNW